MKFQAHGAMHSNPGLAMSNKIEPIGVSTKIHGHVTAEVGAIGVHISEIPVRLRVPFLKRKVHLHLIGTVGGFHAKVDPFSLSIKEMSVDLNGVLGDKNGITITTEGKVNCATEMDVSGALAGHIGGPSLHFGDDDLDEKKHAPIRKKR